jgi:RNA 3'-terminal phosphate cyclase (ATP)
VKTIAIDGSYGEGGGQVLRSALTLSLVTGVEVRITKIRAGRSRPGLLRQHLTCVRAATEISNAECEGAELGSTTLTFRPGRMRAGTYSFAIGSAGSTTLVLATILLPLLLADGESVVRLEGGTHNPLAPPFDFLAEVFFPRLREIGFVATAKLERAGFYPAGGGAIAIMLKGASANDALKPASWLERADVTLNGSVITANLSPSISGREVIALSSALTIDRADVKVTQVASPGPGNVVFARATSQHRVEEIVTSFGERGRSAETVAESAANEMKEYVAAGAPIGEHLADQLLLPLALGAGGSFRCQTREKENQHLTTNAWVLSQFLGDVVTIKPENKRISRVEVKGRAS